MDNKYFDIAELICKYLADSLTDSEKECLANWVKLSEENRKWFQKITAKEFVWQKRQILEAIDWKIGWEDLKLKRHHRHIRHLLGYIVKCACAVVVLVISTFYFMEREKAEKDIPVAMHEIQPGTRKAVLFMANGSSVELGQEKEGVLQEMDGTVIDLAKDRIVYENKDTLFQGEKLYNEIVVPKGGEYRLTLADGTLVYLNADSRLRFPVQFSGATREVELTGEGYFQVTRNEEHPFVVKNSLVEVTVLGTEFNLCCYAENEEIQTTLVEGKVKVTHAGNTMAESGIVLNPGEQAVLNRQDGKMIKKAVDVSYAIAWKDGDFRFRDRPLKEIMALISRWYNVTVIYRDPEVKEILFGCNFKRDSTVQPLLELFQKTRAVHFEIKGKEIIVSK